MRYYPLKFGVLLLVFVATTLWAFSARELPRAAYHQTRDFSLWLLDEYPVQNYMYVFPGRSLILPSTFLFQLYPDSVIDIPLTQFSKFFYVYALFC